LSSFKYHISTIPDGLSFEEAASLPTATYPVIQALTGAHSEIPGGLKGKTVLVPAGFGGVGTVALCSRRRESRHDRLDEENSPCVSATEQGTCRSIVYYTTNDVVPKVGTGSVEFFLNIARIAISDIAVLKPGIGVLFEINGNLERLGEGFSRATIVVEGANGWNRCGVQVESVEMESEM
jgi:hypothetical protein